MCQAVGSIPSTINRKFKTNKQKNTFLASGGEHIFNPSTWEAKVRTRPARAIYILRPCFKKRKDVALLFSITIFEYNSTVVLIMAYCRCFERHEHANCT